MIGFEIFSAVFSGVLIPSVVLWLIGRKIEYDFEFWKLLIITGAAALAREIPFGGWWLSLIVYYGLFWKLTKIDYTEALWVSFLAFMSYMAVSFVLILSIGSFFGSPLSSDPDPEPMDDVPEPVVAPHIPERQEQDPPQEEPKPPPPEDSMPRSLMNAPAAPDWLQEQYTLNGIVKGDGEYRAFINGRVVGENQLLSPDTIIHHILEDRVLIQAKGGLYTLKLRSDK